MQPEKALGAQFRQEFQTCFRFFSVSDLIRYDPVKGWGPPEDLRYDAGVATRPLARVPHALPK